MDWVSGACLLVRREAAEQAGLLDERFFLYTEDVDFCAAIRRAGGRVLFTPAAEIVHLRGRSRATAPAAMQGRLPAQPARVLREAPSALGAAARLYLRSRAVGYSRRIEGGARSSRGRIHSPVRIAIDARKLRDYGIGTYVRNLLRHLSRIDPTTEYVLLCRGDDCGAARSARRELPRGRRSRRPAYSIREQLSRAARSAARGDRSLPRAALRAAAADAVPIGRHDPRLHPPAVPAVPAEPARATRTRARRCGSRRTGRAAC